MSTILERLEYGFDRDSRRTWRKRTLTTGEDNAYGYDGLSQVVNAARGDLNLNATAIGGVPAEVQAWDYDPTGNWRGYETQTNGSVALDQSRVHDKGNQLTQIVGAPNPVLLDRTGRMREVSPDATGNWNQSQKITWDAWSRVVRIEQNGTTTASYAYDGLTRRTTRSTGGATWHSYYSDAWRPLEERRDSQTVPARQYYWGARHRDDLVRQNRATTSGGSLNETRYVLMDYFSPAAITDETGTVKERYAFSAFGVRRILTPTFMDRATSECDFTFAFQGQFLDNESGFLNYGYRFYSPHLGRWLSKDPLSMIGSQNALSVVTFWPDEFSENTNVLPFLPAGLPIALSTDIGNFYLYTSNDPVQIVDSIGLGYCCDCTAATTPPRGPLVRCNKPGKTRTIKTVGNCVNLNPGRKGQVPCWPKNCTGSWEEICTPLPQAGVNAWKVIKSSSKEGICFP